jgi:hypothetical protein
MPTIYATEEAALVRLNRLEAVAKADMPERETPERHRREDMV